MIKILTLSYPNSSFGGPYFVSNLIKLILKKNKLFYFKNLYFKSQFSIFFFKKKKIQSLLENFDLIHCHNFFSLSNMIFINKAKNIGIPYIITTHGNLNIWSMKKNYLIKKIFFFYFKNILQNCEFIHFLNIEEYNEVKSLLSLDKINVLFQQNLINTKKYLIKKKFKDTFNIIFFGRITLKKGIFELIECIKKIKSLDIKNIKFHFVGPIDPKYSSLFFKKIKQYQIEKFLVIKKPIISLNDKKKLFQDKDLFVLPSKDEADSIAIKEALALGTPVLISKDCKFEKNETNKKFVKVIENNDLKNLTLKILQIYKNKRIYRKLSRQISRYAKNSFDISLLDSKKIANIYVDCVTKSKI